MVLNEGRALRLATAGAAAAKAHPDYHPGDQVVVMVFPAGDHQAMAVDGCPGDLRSAMDAVMKQASAILSAPTPAPRMPGGWD